MYTIEDLIFLQNQFGKLTDSKIDVLPTDYIEKVRYLPSELTPMPGKYSYDKCPYMKEIINHLSQRSDARKIVLMKSAQIMATTALIESGIAYCIEQEPSSQLYISADKELVKIGMETKVERLLDTCNLRRLIFSQTSQRTKKTGDTTTSKSYPSGFLHAIGAQTPGKLRQMSYKIMWMDEVDGFPQEVGKEGSPIDLAERRTKAFSQTRKIFYLSTPTITQISHIYALYLQGNQKNWYMPCPFCKTMQVFKWHGVTKEGHVYGIVFEVDEEFNPIYESVGYRCINPDCKKLIKNYHKSEILLKGEWRSTSKSKEPGLYSYWINSLVSPVGIYSWEDMVAEWIKCWDVEKSRVKDERKFKTFYNTDRGLPYEEKGESISYEKVMFHRRSFYLQNQIPNNKIIEECGSPILLLVASIDVQRKDCIYLDVKGYTENGCTWTILFKKIEGEVKIINKGVWKEINDILTNKVWTADDNRQYKINITFIDSGHEAKVVYEFCKNYSSGVYPCKGDPRRLGTQITFKQFNKETLEKEGLSSAYHVNAYKQKDAISTYMNRLVWETGKKQPSFYPNFPDDLHDDYFKMFEAEQKFRVIDKITNRFKRWEWRQTTPSNDNHGLDTYVYNLTALEVMADYYCREYIGINYLDWSRFWKLAKEEVFLHKNK